MLDRIAMVLPLLPLAAAFIIGLAALGGRPLRERVAGRLAVGAVLLSLGCAVGLFANVVMARAPHTILVAPWLECGSYRVPIELLVDPLSTSLALLVTGVGAVVVRFSVNYMHRERGCRRLFALRCRFLAAMRSR